MKVFDGCAPIMSISSSSLMWPPGGKMDAIMGPHGAFEGMKEGVRAGKIRFAAFRMHSLPAATEIIHSDYFDAVQIPFSFVDWQTENCVVAVSPPAFRVHP